MIENGRGLVVSKQQNGCTSGFDAALGAMQQRNGQDFVYEIKSLTITWFKR